MIIFFLFKTDDYQSFYNETSTLKNSGVATKSVSSPPTSSETGSLLNLKRPYLNQQNSTEFSEDEDTLGDKSTEMFKQRQQKKLIKQV